jgi:hypothetical protein
MGALVMRHPDVQRKRYLRNYRALLHGAVLRSGREAKVPANTLLPRGASRTKDSYGMPSGMRFAAQLLRQHPSGGNTPAPVAMVAMVAMVASETITPSRAVTEEPLRQQVWLGCQELTLSLGPLGNPRPPGTRARRSPPVAPRPSPVARRPSPAACRPLPTVP